MGSGCLGPGSGQRTAKKLISISTISLAQAPARQRYQGEPFPYTCSPPSCTQGHKQIAQCIGGNAPSHNARIATDELGNGYHKEGGHLAIEPPLRAR